MERSPDEENKALRDLTNGCDSQYWDKISRRLYNPSNEPQAYESEFVRLKRSIDAVESKVDGMLVLLDMLVEALLNSKDTMKEFSHAESSESENLEEGSILSGGDGKD